MQMIYGNFNGTGADVYLQLGSIPYSIWLWNLESATVETYEWHRAMIHDTLSCEGIGRPKGGGAVLDLAFGEGISPYYGSDLLTTSNQTSTTYGEGVYLERDDKDYRFYTDSAAGISGDAATEDITTWTLDTAATPTGHFNGDVTGTYIGEGSLIRIVDSDNQHTYECSILALTAGQGLSSDEVTLSMAVPSGTVQFIGGMYSYVPSAVGKTTRPGVKISNTTLNANNGMVGFHAICP